MITKKKQLYIAYLNKLGYNIDLDFKDNNYILTINKDSENEIDNNNENAVKNSRLVKGDTPFTLEI